MLLVGQARSVVLNRRHSVLYLIDADARQRAFAPRDDAWLLSEASTESDAIAVLSWGEVSLVLIDRREPSLGPSLAALLSAEDAPAVAVLTHDMLARPPIAEAVLVPRELEASELTLRLLGVIDAKRLARFVHRTETGELVRLETDGLYLSDLIRVALERRASLMLRLEGPSGLGHLSLSSNGMLDVRYGAAIGADALFLALLVPPTAFVAILPSAQPRASRSIIEPAVTLMGQLDLLWNRWKQIAQKVPAFDATISAKPGVKVPDLARDCLRNPEPLRINLMHIADGHLEVLRCIADMYAKGELKDAHTEPPGSAALRGSMPYRLRTVKAMQAVAQPTSRAPAMNSPVAEKPVVAPATAPKFGGTVLNYGGALKTEMVAPVLKARPTVSVPAAAPTGAVLRSAIPPSDEAPQTARSMELAESMRPSSERAAQSAEGLRPTVSAPPPSSHRRSLASVAAAPAATAEPAFRKTSHSALSAVQAAKQAAPVQVVMSGPAPSLQPLASQATEGPIPPPRRRIDNGATTFTTPRQRSGPPAWVWGLCVLALVGTSGLVGYKLKGRAPSSSPPTEPMAHSNAVVDAPPLVVPTPAVAAPIETTATSVEPADAGAPVNASPLWTHRELSRALDKGRHEKVIEEAKRVLEKNPQDALVWEVLGTALRNIGARKEAKEAYLQCARFGKGAWRAECLAFANR